MTKQIAQILNIKEAHGIDVVSDPNWKEISTIHFHEGDIAKLNLPDEYFDLITAIMSLHHIKYLDEAVKKIYKLLKPGGALVIKEHDCWTAYDAMMVDIEHAIFMKCLAKKDIRNSDYYIAYKNYFGWDDTFKELKVVYGDYYYPSIYHNISSTRAYWTIYKK